MSDRTTTIATCWLVTLVDTTVMGFTDHDTDLTVASQLYKSAVGYIPSAIQNNTELSPDNMDLMGIIDDDGIKEADLRAGRYDHADVRIFKDDYTDLPSGEIQSLVKGKLGAASLSDGQFTVELNSLANLLNTNVGERYGTLCPADLGDDRCKVIMGPFTHSLTVTSVPGSPQTRLTFLDTSQTEADDYFNGGICTWLTGNNAGYEMDIKDYVLSTGTLTLFEPMPFDIEVGDTATITAGCDKTNTTCKDTFNNIVNFRAHPHIPGVQKLIGQR